MTADLKNAQDFILTTPIQWDSSWPELAGEGERTFLLSYMYNRFGISSNVFDGYILFTKKKTYWFLSGSSLVPAVSHLKIKRLGIKAFQEVGSFIKPTTRFIQSFGSMATKATFNIDENQLKELLNGEYLPVEEGLENGYVILSFKGQVLGLGLLINGKVRSQLPLNDVRFLTIECYV